jgi:putative nucleotidyltransferase with HDIG domain
MPPVKPPTIDLLVNDTAVVYSLPQIYQRFNLVINHPRSSIADITKVITEDTGISSCILKLANSPMYGYHSNIDSISKAIMIIGTQQLRDMVLAISVLRVFKGIPEYLINMTSFWQHSITIGIVSRILATYLREPNLERFFVTGILHDVGQMILCTRTPELVQETIATSRKSGEPNYAIQRSMLGFDHGDVGGELLKRWRIPEIIAEPVACHHAPGRAKLFPMETSLIHVADVIGHAMQVGVSGESFVPPMDEYSWERLGIPVSMLSTIITQADTQLIEALAILSGDVSS